MFAAVAKLATTFERTMWARFNHGVRISTHARLGRAQGNLAQCRKVGLQSLNVQTQSIRRLDGISFTHCSAALSLSRTPADGLARQHAAAVVLDGETTHSGEASRSGVPPHQDLRPRSQSLHMWASGEVNSWRSEQASAMW